MKRIGRGLQSKFLISLTLVTLVTKVTATPIPMAEELFLLTPMKGQIPMNFTRIKLFTNMYVISIPI